jgi:cell division septal protein FtsQ
LRELTVERNERTKKSISKLQITLAVAAVAVIAALLLNSPFFNINAVEFSGNSIVSEEQIKGKLGFGAERPLNYFLLNKKSCEELIAKIPYIKSVSVAKIFPDKLLVSVVERTVRCYVEYTNMDMFLLIDEEGMVLEVHSYMRLKLPLVVGLSYNSFSVGEYLNADDAENFNNVVIISRLFEKYEFDDLLKIDVSDKNEIHLFIKGVDVKFGSLEDADRKISTLKLEIQNLEQRFDDMRGFLDISDINSPDTFTPLK